MKLKIPAVIKLPAVHPIQAVAAHAVKYNAYRHLQKAVVYSAMVVLFADMIAAVWPAFNEVWEGHAHIALALAALGASITEWLDERGDEERDRRIEEHEERLRLKEKS
jgi:hypothetical protein